MGEHITTRSVSLNESRVQPDETEYTGLLELLPKQKQAYRELMEAEQGSYLLLGYGGALGGGKSALIGRAINDLALGYPGISILLCRQELTTLKETTLRELFRQLNPALISKKNENEGWCEIRDPSWPAGIKSRIKWLGVADYEKAGSAQYQAIFFDEASEASGEMGKLAAGYLIGRLRFGFFPRNVENILRQQCGHVDHVRGDCTGDTRFKGEYCKASPCWEHDDFVKCPNICPDGQCPKHGAIKGNGAKYLFFAASNPAPGFFTDWFWKKDLGELERTLPGKAAVRFVHALPKDNPYNGENYVAVLRATLATPEEVARLVDGRFDVFAGMVYEVLEKSVHAYWGPIPQYNRVIGGIDLGFEQADAHYTAGVVGIVSAQGRLIRVDAFKERGPGVYKRLGLWMAEMEKKWGTPAAKRVRWVCDRSQGLGIAELKKSFDIVPSKGGRDSLESGIRVVATRLNKDEIGHPGSYFLPYGHDQGSAEKWYEDAREWVRDKETHKPMDEPDLCAADRYMHEAAGQVWGDPGRFLNQVPRVA